MNGMAQPSCRTILFRRPSIERQSGLVLAGSSFRRFFRRPCQRLLLLLGLLLLLLLLFLRFGGCRHHFSLSLHSSPRRPFTDVDGCCVLTWSDLFISTDTQTHTQTRSLADSSESYEKEANDSVIPPIIDSQSTVLMTTPSGRRHPAESAVGCAGRVAGCNGRLRPLSQRRKRPETVVEGRFAMGPPMGVVIRRRRFACGGGGGGGGDGHR